MVACFVAVEAGALVVCIGIMLIEEGLLGFFEGIATWIVGQLIILPIALVSIPFGALLRLIFGILFERPRTVALSSGAVIGVAGSVFLVLLAQGGWSVLIMAGTIGLVAGICGGWTWWRIEKPHLDRQGPPEIQ